MDKWRCAVCGYIYNPEIGDPENGIMPGVLFEELPDSWGCPECGAEKELFETCTEADDLDTTENF